MPFLRRDDVALYFEKTEGSAAPVVLAHGWCCDHSYLADQAEHFARAGHSVLSLDLRGHGRSDKPQQAYPMQVFADDIAWLCGELRVAKPIVIGHSMGGIIAFELAARHADLPMAIVMLDAAVVLSPGARAAIPPFLDKLRGPAYAAAQRDYVARALFLPTDDAGRKARILGAMGEAPQHVMIAAFEGLSAYDASAAQGRIKAASLYIAGNEPQPRCDIDRLRELLPHLHYGQTVGSGHFCQMEVPAQVNAMIDRFLAVAESPTR
jgi:pimeloyl-ACP methyl ester carboxylesterase